MTDMVSVKVNTQTKNKKIMTKEEAKNQWSHVKLETIFEDMVDLKPANWSQTWDQWHAAIAYSRQWNSEGIYPSEYKGYRDKKVLFGFSCSDAWKATKDTAIKVWRSTVSIAKKAWHWVRNVGKARRHSAELEKFALNNPGHFVLAWNPEFRTFDAYVAWCGEALAIKRVQQALGKQ